jgi:hypothetical protein
VHRDRHRRLAPRPSRSSRSTPAPRCSPRSRSERRPCCVARRRSARRPRARPSRARTEMWRRGPRRTGREAYPGSRTRQLVTDACAEMDVAPPRGGATSFC